jgi:O-methyltransferase
MTPVSSCTGSIPRDQRGGILAHPATRGILLDQPTVVARTPPLAAAGLAGRCRIVGGDARQSVPASGDCYVVKRLLMEQPDDGAIAILRNCAEAMTAGGRVLVVEMVIPPTDEPAAGKTYDVIMLATFSGGRIRTEAELRTLFASAGLVLTSVIPTSSPNFIVEGVRS